MKFKSLNTFVFCSSLMLFAYTVKNKNEQKIILDNYYITKDDKDFENLLYTSEFKEYRDNLYIYVVFD